jgi:phosphate transport system protein
MTSSATSEFNNLRTSLEQLALAVLDQIHRLEVALASKNLPELQEIVKKDKDIDLLEMSFDRLAKTFMELRAPLGPDFRFVLSALDISRNLERIGDCIEYVARHVAGEPKINEEFPAAMLIVIAMTEKCRDILQKSIHAWQKNDLALARKIPDLDDFVDALQDQAYSLAIREVRAGKVDVETGLVATLVTNKLESIADIACHIAEAVVFIISAQQIRHDLVHKR